MTPQTANICGNPEDSALLAEYAHQFNPEAQISGIFSYESSLRRHRDNRVQDLYYLLQGIKYTMPGCREDIMAKAIEDFLHFTGLPSIENAAGFRLPTSEDYAQPFSDGQLEIIYSDIEERFQILRDAGTQDPKSGHDKHGSRKLMLLTSWISEAGVNHGFDYVQAIHAYLTEEGLVKDELKVNPHEWSRFNAFFGPDRVSRGITL